MLINGVPLIAVIMALVEWLKKVGLPAQWLPYASMGLGIAMGVLAAVAQKMPTTLQEWLGAITAGLVLGLSASGLYDLGKGLLKA